MKFGKAITFLAAAALAAGSWSWGANPSSAEDPDLSWPPGAIHSPDRIGFIVEDGWLLSSAIRTASPYLQPMCSSLNDPVCIDSAAQYGWWILRVAPPCTVALEWEECVEGVAVRGEDGIVRDLNFIGLAPGPTFAPVESRGLPTGSTMSLFEDPENPHIRYAAYLGGQMGGRRGPFYLHEFSAQLIPYRTVRMGQQPAGGTCLFEESGNCSYRVAFPADTSFRLSVKLSNKVTGWLGGRLSDPTLEVEQATGSLNRLAVTADPVDVPLVAVGIPVSEASPQIMDYWRKTFTCEGNVPCTRGVVSGQSSGPHGATLLDLFSEQLGDTATKLIPTWSVSSLPIRSDKVQPCLDSTTRLMGLVTTNATVYESSPPSFVARSLRYKVAGLHRIPGGEVFSGSYNLLLRSDAARCLYGFSNAPVTAEISVISSDGVEQVATTSVSERGGWLRLGAAGFHFSQPTISVTLSSQAPASRAIVCKKGKQRRLVSGSAPVCPDGWKRVTSKKRFTIQCLKQNSGVEGPRRVTLSGTERRPPQCPAGYRLRR